MPFHPCSSASGHPASPRGTGELLDALERTVSALHEHDRDAALVEYLRLLAAEMDRSEEVERGAAAALPRAA